jgi:hypothetical protein
LADVTDDIDGQHILLTVLENTIWIEPVSYVYGSGQAYCGAIHVESGAFAVCDHVVAVAEVDIGISRREARGAGSGMMDKLARR